MSFNPYISVRVVFAILCLVSAMAAYLTAKQIESSKGKVACLVFAVFMVAAYISISQQLPGYFREYDGLPFLFHVIWMCVISFNFASAGYHLILWVSGDFRMKLTAWIRMALALSLVAFYVSYPHVLKSNKSTKMVTVCDTTIQGGAQYERSVTCIEKVK